MSFDLTKLVGFYFNGLEVDTVDINPSTSNPGIGSYTLLPYVSASNPGDFEGNNSDNGIAEYSVVEDVTAASNGTSIDGSPLTNPAALGQIVYNDIVNGAASPSNTYDVLGYSADGSSILVGLASAYVPASASDPYMGAYAIISDTNIDGNATSSLFPTSTAALTFSATNTYTGGPVAAGGVAADLVTVTNALVGLTIPSNAITTTTATGVTVNTDGSFGVASTNTVLAVGKGTFSAGTGSGLEGQSTLKFTAAAGTVYFQVVGWNSTQILLQVVSSSGVATKSYDILSISNPPPANASVGLSFSNYGTAPLVGQAYPCFMRGTRIATPDGTTLVECLRPGDMVLTVGGAARPVIWLGSARVTPRRHADPARVAPVCVSAGAIADAVPQRDLYVSPDHALFIDDMLIPAKELINGTSIRQVDRTVVDYFHVELAQHDVLYAEGMPAETYLDCGNRGALQGAPLIAGGFDVPHLNYMIWESLGFRPLTVSGKALRAVQARLARRAAAWQQAA